jgi:hypothetical protein
MTSLINTEGRKTRSATASKGTVATLSPRLGLTDSTCRDSTIILPSLGEVSQSEIVRERNGGKENEENKSNELELATSERKESKQLLEPEKKKELLSQKTLGKSTLNEKKGGKEMKG